MISSGAKNANQDGSLAENSNLMRAVRAAEPAGRRKQQQKKNKAARKSRRNKNRKKKGRKNKKKKISKTQGLKRKDSRINQAPQARTCMTKKCIDTAVTNMKKLNSMVRNFEAQKKRLERFVKQAGSKSNKSANFAPLIAKLTALGGGNSSNLLCNGEKNNGSALMTNLTVELGKCDEAIVEACSSKVPKLNETQVAFLDACNVHMQAFKNKSDAAGMKEGSEACALWESSEMAMLAKNVNKTCLPKDLLAEATSGNKACKKQYQACRGLVAEVGDVLSACSPANSKEKVKEKITAGVKNQAAAKKVQDKVKAVLSSRASSRSSNVTCLSFSGQVSMASEKLAQAPLAPGLQAEMLYLAVTVVSPCDQAAKNALMTSQSKLEVSQAALDQAVNVMIAVLLQSTGEVFDTSAVNTTEIATTTVAATTTTTATATTTTPTPTAAPTTPAPTAAPTTVGATAGASTAAASTAASGK